MSEELLNNLLPVSLLINRAQPLCEHIILAGLFVVVLILVVVILQ